MEVDDGASASASPCVCHGVQKTGHAAQHTAQRSADSLNDRRADGLDAVGGGWMRAGFIQRVEKYAAGAQSFTRTFYRPPT